MYVLKRDIEVIMAYRIVQLTQSYKRMKNVYENITCTLEIRNSFQEFGKIVEKLRLKSFNSYPEKYFNPSPKIYFNRKNGRYTTKFSG